MKQHGTHPTVSGLGQATTGGAGGLLNQASNMAQGHLGAHPQGAQGLGAGGLLNQASNMAQGHLGAHPQGAQGLGAGGLLNQAGNFIERNLPGQSQNQFIPPTTAGAGAGVGGVLNQASNFIEGKLAGYPQGAQGLGSGGGLLNQASGITGAQGLGSGGGLLNQAGGIAGAALLGDQKHSVHPTTTGAGAGGLLNQATNFIEGRVGQQSAPLGGNLTGTATQLLGQNPQMAGQAAGFVAQHPQVAGALGGLTGVNPSTISSGAGFASQHPQLAQTAGNFISQHPGVLGSGQQPGGLLQGATNLIGGGRNMTSNVAAPNLGANATRGGGIMDNVRQTVDNILPGQSTGGQYIPHS